MLDDAGMPIELGSGRFAKTYLGEEVWVESKTAFRRKIAIKILQKGVSVEDQMRFQLEKQILEHVQGHPNIVEMLASGESDNPDFIPPSLRDRVENDFMMLELLDMSLEERLKGTRNRRAARGSAGAVARRSGCCARWTTWCRWPRRSSTPTWCATPATATSSRPTSCSSCPTRNLEGSPLQVKLADFNTGKATVPDTDISVTRFRNVPGTIYFQSPEQETNILRAAGQRANGLARRSSTSRTSTSTSARTTSSRSTTGPRSTPSPRPIGPASG